MQHVGEPSLRVDVVELGGDDQAIEKSGALSATIGSGEQPGLAPQRQATQRSFGAIVVVTKPQANFPDSAIPVARC